MKFRMRVRPVGNTGEGWWESYDKPGRNANKIAARIVDYFNGTLHEGETPRELLEVIVDDATPNTSRHDWEKTNAFTIRGTGRYGSHDTYRCKACGITGKRFGLEPGVAIDSRYRAKAYRDCQTAKAKLAK